MKHSRNKSKAKNTRLIFILIPLMLFSISAFSQQSDFTAKIEVKNNSEINLSNAEILVICNNGKPEYLFQIYDEIPIATAKALAQSERIESNNYKFIGLKPGTYYICIYDGENNMVSKKVELSHQ